MFLSATARPLPALARPALMTQSADALENNSIAPLTSYRTALERCLDWERRLARTKKLLDKTISSARVLPGLQFGRRVDSICAPGPGFRTRHGGSRQSRVRCAGGPSYPGDSGSS